MSAPALILYLEVPGDFGLGVEEIELPVKMAVCPRCDGKGTHVNPAIDGHGISPEEFRDDPEFGEAYFRGDYDVRCETCDGRNVVPVPDWAKMPPEHVKAYKKQIDEEAADRIEAEQERRMGA